MALYRILRTQVLGGFASVFFNGQPVLDEGYEEGSTINVSIVPSNGGTATDANTTFGRSGFPPQSGLNYSFTMPSFDIVPRILLIGYVLPPSSAYGLQYFFEWSTKDESEGPNRRLEIYQRGYLGDYSERKMKDMRFIFGKRDEDILKTVITTAYEFTLPTNNDEYFELITGDNRRFLVKVLHLDSDWVWEGYVWTDLIEAPERSGVTYFINMKAFDGTESFEAIRANRGAWSGQTYRTRPNNEPVFPDFSQKAITAIAGVLAQSFITEKKPINISCELYENRMDDSVGMFEQWRYGENAIFDDGVQSDNLNRQPPIRGKIGKTRTELEMLQQRGRFIEDSTARIVNEQLFLIDVLERIVNPFLCRVFLWKNEWYIVRLEEFTKEQIKFYRYDGDSDFLGTDTIENDQETDCISNGFRTARTVFTEFTTVLNLGAFVGDVSSANIINRFESGEWISARTRNGSQTFILRYWKYIRSVGYDPGAREPRFGDTAGVQYVSDGGDFCRIWTTTQLTGVNDPNISYISRLFGEFNRSESFIFQATETANLITFNAKWIIRAAIADRRPDPQGYFVGFGIRIADKYLVQTTLNELTWTETESIVFFPVQSRVDLVNTIEIPQISVPESGEIELRLYQLIAGPTAVKDHYLIDWAEANVEIVEDDSLALSQIKRKEISSVQYTKVHPEYNIYLGDTSTNQSSSSMRLDAEGEEWDTDVTRSWGDLEETILDNINRNIISLKGRTNVSVYGDTIRTIYDPFKALIYDGKKWLINHMIIEEWANEANKIELYDIGNIEPPNLDVIVNWELNETPNGVYLDSNARIYLDDNLILTAFVNSNGEFNAVIGQEIRVDYFYFANLHDDFEFNSPVLQLIINDVLIDEQPIVLDESSSHTYSFVAESNNISILVRSNYYDALDEIPYEL